MVFAGLTAELVVTGEAWADIGTDTTLTCSPGDGILAVRWRDSSFNSTDIDNTFNIVRLVIQTGDLVNRNDTHYGFDPNDPLYPLTIKQVTLDDEAKYWCEVFLDGLYIHDSKELRIRGRTLMLSDII